MSGTSPATAKAGEPGHPGHGRVHVVPLSILAAVFVALGVLTFLTVAATWAEEHPEIVGLDLGGLNLWIALGIATIKASLVALYFMHLRYDHPFNALIFVVGLMFLALLLTMTMLDTGQYQPDIRNW